MEFSIHDRHTKTLVASDRGCLLHAGYNAKTRRLTLRGRFPGGHILSIHLSQEEARELYKRLKPSGETDFTTGIIGPEARIAFPPLRKWQP